VDLAFQPCIDLYKPGKIIPSKFYKQIEQILRSTNKFALSK